LSSSAGAAIAGGQATKQSASPPERHAARWPI
jgi:hypothetical protein